MDQIYVGKIYNNSTLIQRAKKVVSDSPGLVDFAIGLVIFVLKASAVFWGKFKLQKDCNQSCQWKRVLGLVEMTCGLVHTSHSLPKWQAVKLTFFAPYLIWLCMQCSPCQVLAYLSKKIITKLWLSKVCTHKVVSLCPHQANFFNISWLLACCLGYHILSLSFNNVAADFCQLVRRLPSSSDGTIFFERPTVCCSFDSNITFHKIILPESLAICIPAISRFSHYRFTNFQWVSLYISLQWKARWWCISVTSLHIVKLLLHGCAFLLNKTGKSCLASHQSCLPCFGSFNASRARR